ncbi:oxygenase MpaB family protein [Saccharopolyspora sp. WRP15-2]|uniref:Oxygenase MpaB family protein n=1 Tax=Saccharopolyspora oryzae TaxID=2997343 RepID=A0ABT4V6K9_9PSEU|nr:oxygenase MpaB family protein [Saccharopolyspora oryzae]MDA3629610.1 oxygenase MpaB family protein [Saccharopolyspora oryzae]
MSKPTPLGPDSLMWRYFGDWRGLLLALWAGSMQNMHPQLGAGVDEHSQFFDERWERLYRSLYPIGGVVYDGPRAEQTARQVRGYHDTIKGVDKHGRPYHALNPDTYFWAHSTFLVMPILINEHFGEPLSEEQKAQVYAEGVQWYRLYGMSMRPVPPDWPSFQRYWDHMCREVLEDNKATRDVLDLSRIGKPPTMRWLPEPLWKLARIPIGRGFTWLTVGLYDQAIRDKLGYRWTARDERLMRVVGRALAVVWRFVPFERRYHPRARAAWRRVRGKAPADAPLVETPPRNLPPPDRRDDPKHYSPAQAG